MKRLDKQRRLALKLFHCVNDVFSYDKGKERMKESVLTLINSSKDSRINLKRNGKETIETLTKQIKRLR